MYNAMRKECTECNEWDNYRIIGEKMSGKERHLYLLHCALFEIAPLGALFSTLPFSYVGGCLPHFRFREVTDFIDI